MKWNANNLVQDLNSGTDSISNDDNRYIKLASTVFLLFFEVSVDMNMRHYFRSSPLTRAVYNLLFNADKKCVDNDGDYMENYVF